MRPFANTKACFEFRIREDGPGRRTLNLKRHVELRPATKMGKTRFHKQNFKTMFFHVFCPMFLHGTLWKNGLPEPPLTREKFKVSLCAHFSLQAPLLRTAPLSLPLPRVSLCAHFQSASASFAG